MRGAPAHTSPAQDAIAGPSRLAYAHAHAHAHRVAVASPAPARRGFLQDAAAGHWGPSSSAAANFVTPTPAPAPAPPIGAVVTAGQFVVPSQPPWGPPRVLSPSPMSSLRAEATRARAASAPPPDAPSLQVRSGAAIYSPTTGRRLPPAVALAGGEAGTGADAARTRHKRLASTPGSACAFCKRRKIACGGPVPGDEARRCG